MSVGRLNIWAIAVCLIVMQLHGFLWYGVFFDDAWLTAAGLSADEINPSNPTPFVISIITNIIAATALALVVNRFGTDNALKGAGLGVFVWLGFAVMAVAPHYAFAGRPLAQFAIESGDTMVGLMLAGAIVGAWSNKPTSSGGS